MPGAAVAAPAYSGAAPGSPTSFAAASVKGVCGPEPGVAVRAVRSGMWAAAWLGLRGRAHRWASMHKGMRELKGGGIS